MEQNVIYSRGPQSSPVLYEDPTTDPLAIDEYKNFELSSLVPEIDVALDDPPEPKADPLDISGKIGQENETDTDYIKQEPSSPSVSSPHFDQVTVSFVADKYDPLSNNDLVQSTGISSERDPLMLKQEINSVESTVTTESEELNQETTESEEVNQETTVSEEVNQETTESEEVNQETTESEEVNQETTESEELNQETTESLEEGQEIVVFDEASGQYYVGNVTHTPTSIELHSYSDGGGVESDVFSYEEHETWLIAMPPPSPADLKDGFAPDRTSEMDIAGHEIGMEPSTAASSSTEPNAKPNAKSPKCNRCMTTFPNYMELNRHRRMYHSKGVFRCETCRRAFPTNYFLQVHMLNHSSSPVVVIDELPPVKCDLCNKMFTNKWSLSKHYKTHGRGRYVCEICDSSFHRKAHLVAHSGFLYGCNVCDVTFANVENLLLHRATHSDTCQYDIVIRPVPKCSKPIE